MQIISCGLQGYFTYKTNYKSAKRNSVESIKNICHFSLVKITWGRTSERNSHIWINGCMRTEVKCGRRKARSAPQMLTIPCRLGRWILDNRWRRLVGLTVMVQKVGEIFGEIRLKRVYLLALCGCIMAAGVEITVMAEYAQATTPEVPRSVMEFQVRHP